MYLTKNSNFVRPAFRNSFFDDAFMKDFFNPGFKSEMVATPAANIRETKDKYAVELLVPGWNKEDFHIALEKNNLVISAEKKEEKKEEGERFNRREFRQYSFKRMFELPETVNAAEISARYENGILELALPKKNEVQVELSKKIEVK
ncbi:MAG: Hsp20/alpha crystallin family protein [Flavobacteriales bacterium]